MNARLQEWNKHQASLRSIVALGPIAGYHLKALHLFWPPLGSTGYFGAYFATLIAWLSGYSAFLLKSRKSANRLFLVAAIGALAMLMAYVYLTSSFVKSINTPKNGVQYRSVGFRRTNAALNLYPDASDGELLEKNGLEDKDIEKMWTTQSVADVRFALFFSGLITWCLISLALGAFARSTFAYKAKL